MAICKHRRCSLFFFGAGIGAVAGVLLAPKSGREIRRELFGGSPDLFAGEESAAAQTEPAADLKARIEETRARLKDEVEAEQEKKS